MRCPACGAELVVAEREGVELDWCPLCRGLWFDAGELEAVEATLGVRFKPIQGEKSQGLRVCPRCDQAMDAIAVKGTPALSVDACPRGHGYWFDAGELAASVDPSAGTVGDVVTFLGERLRRKP